LLAYRYNNNYNSLATVQNLFGNAGAAAFQNDDIDGYSDGPLQTTLDTNADFVMDNPAFPWAGADNTNHFFTPSDLFDTNNSSILFTNRLLNAGNSVSTYDRYTFYRMLSQLGTDTTPESGKMDLNYDNLDPGLNGVLNVNGTASATNFVPWTPLGFFTNAADRMLRAYSTEWLNADSNNFAATFGTNAAFGIADIPVWVSNRFVYTPAVQRVLQLAANIYDASTPNFYPSVFRPIFEHDNFNNVFITLARSYTPKLYANNHEWLYRERLWRAVDHRCEERPSELQQNFSGERVSDHAQVAIHAQHEHMAICLKPDVYHEHHQLLRRRMLEFLQHRLYESGGYHGAAWRDSSPHQRRAGLFISTS
jgi:hypothetical protein